MDYRTTSSDMHGYLESIFDLFGSDFHVDMVNNERFNYVHKQCRVCLYFGLHDRRTIRHDGLLGNRHRRWRHRELLGISYRFRRSIMYDHIR